MLSTSLTLPNGRILKNRVVKSGLSEALCDSKNNPTNDLISIFKSNFPAEELIHYFHILLHADDSLILATSKDSLVKKFIKLDEYCLHNNIKLQLSKCCFLAINSDAKDDIVLENGVIKMQKNLFTLALQLQMR